jgi:hypothetical protein
VVTSPVGSPLPEVSDGLCTEAQPELKEYM